MSSLFEVYPNAAFGRNQKGISDSRLQIPDIGSIPSGIWNMSSGIPQDAHRAELLRRKTLLDPNPLHRRRKFDSLPRDSWRGKTPSSRIAPPSTRARSVPGHRADG